MKLDHYNHSWGGVNYTTFLLTEFPDSNLVSTVTTKTTTMDFIYPRKIGQNDIDGVAEGHFTLYNSESSGTAITAYTITLYKTADIPTSMTALGSYTNTLSSDNFITAYNYLTLPIYMDITHDPDNPSLENDEKLVLRISYTSMGSNVCICHANDSTSVDIKIKIPFAPTG